MGKNKRDREEEDDEEEDGDLTFGEFKEFLHTSLADHRSSCE
jgi:hypothetical protein